MARNPPAPAPRSLAPIAREMANPRKEVQRAVVDPKGGELWGLQNAATSIWTVFTEPGDAHKLYTAENWVRIQVTLQTAGPVAIGTAQNMAPVTSGRNSILLDTNVPVIMVLPRATTLYIIAGASNRVTCIVEPIPWLEQLSMQLAAIQAAVGMVASGVGGYLTSFLDKLRMR